VAIAYQPAMTADPISARPALPRGPHRLVAVTRPRRGWTATRLAVLVAATAVGVALTIAIVVGAGMFALANLAG
jgi:hypothetical protein